jgi:hypothetical protein
MILIGWIAIAVIGGYAVFAATLTASLWALRGGLEVIPAALFLAACATAIWLGVVAWLSPLAIGWGV